VQRLGSEQRLRARHILVESEAEAQAVIARLDSGEDFADLARQYSIGPSAERGGDLGYFDPTRMVPEFSQAAAAMEVGSFSREPVKTPFGWHVIQLVDRSHSGVAPFEELQDSLREHVSMIPQDPQLFHRSLMENIRYGRLDASDAEVIEAAQKAHAHEFILQTEKGYDSLVGERGVKLSGGQRQRVAIARAILKDAPILILDEATSSLDSVTEKKIQLGLGNLMQGRTVVVVAHRLSTIAHMDRILVFDQGRIVEDGSHEELLGANGHYARLWNMQAGGFLPDVDEPSSV